ncbi:MAG: ArsR family transcriptional regulator [Halobacteriota archaeon]
MDEAKILDILGNANRRNILKLLSLRPFYVTEISERLHVAPKAIISHLNMLERAGMIAFFVDERRRKYFHIAENFRLEVMVTPFTYGAEAIEVDTTEPENIEHTSVDRITIKTRSLTDLAETLVQLRRASRELSYTQKRVQDMMTQVMDKGARKIGTIANDFVDFDILAAMMTGPKEVERLSKSLSMHHQVIIEHLSRLEKQGVIKGVDDNRYWFTK